MVHIETAVGIHSLMPYYRARYFRIVKVQYHDCFFTAKQYLN